MPSEIYNGSLVESSLGGVVTLLILYNYSRKSIGYHELYGNVLLAESSISREADEDNLYKIAPTR